MVTRTFHVLYVPDGLIAGCLDAIRVLANPAEKNRAHITVRGPYRHSRPRIDTINRLIESSEINIHGSGNFFASGQNTVFLQCKSPRLKDVWDKPDYDFNPHITLYDGPSRDFASMLWKIVSSHSYDISFVAGPLTPLVSAHRYQGGMALRADLDLRLLRELTGLHVNGLTIQSLDHDGRLAAIAKLCDYLATLGPRSDLRPGQMSSHTATAFHIEEVRTNSWALSEVKALAKKNSATLGFLPDGAFDTYSHSGWVLAAMENGDLVGYVVYRVSNMRATLVHLCTEQGQRGRGVARQLFRSVVGRTKDLKGILAHTRRDFPSHAMWPRLGFAALGEKQGRGLNQSVLTRWWYDHPHPTLFSNSASSESAHSPIDVAIDLNVFYDLIVPSSRGGAEESRSLQSDWLMDEIQLCVTSELFNEINRLPSPQDRQGQRSFAHEFKRITGDLDTFEKTYSLLSSIMGKAKTARQTSDFRHLAHTAAANVGFFVTRDENILKHHEDIERETGVTPLSPTDLVIEVDQVRNTASYHPARLRGTSIQVDQVERRQRETIEDIFLNNALGERKSDFRRRLSSLLPSRASLNTKVVLKENEPVALYSFDGTSPNILAVPCLRLRPGQLARTLARLIVTMAIEWSITHNYIVTAVTDNWLEPSVEEALAEDGFVKNGAHWIKLNYRAMVNECAISDGLRQLLARVTDSGLELPGFQLPVLPTKPSMTAAQTALFERSLRPLKLTNQALDTLVIPVRPNWAQHLFDSNLADQTLFGALPDLALNWENAYYRSPRSFGSISSPFRILWYVSKDRRYTGTGQIRAYSVGSRVELLPATEAFKRYKRLGVYDFEQVLELSGGDPNGEVMVIPFSDTEMLKNPLDRKRLTAVLTSLGQHNPSLRGPQRISEPAFAEIYRLGQA